MKNLSHLFKTLATPLPQAGFEERIFRALHRAQAKQLRMELAFIWSGLLASGGMLVGGMFFWKEALFGSEFWSLVSLAFSDASAVMTHASDFMYSLLETLPMMPLLGIFGGLAVLNLFLGLLGSFRAEHRQTGLFSLNLSI